MSSVAENDSASKPGRAPKKSTSNASPAQLKTEYKQNDDTQLSTPNDEQEAERKEKDTPTKRPSKRRKVNHACVYCRRSHMTCDQARPCSRCIKRNIPHLCHDEPRDSKRGSRGESDKEQEEESYSPHERSEDRMGPVPNPNLLPSSDRLGNLNRETIVPAAGTANPDVSSSHVDHGDPSQGFDPGDQLFNGLNNIPPEQLQGIQMNPLNNMFNNSELTTEYTLINNFLTSSLLEDGDYYQGEDPQAQFSDPSLANIMGPLSIAAPMLAANGQYAQQQSTPQVNGSSSTDKTNKGKEVSKVDKAQEKYYMLAADPGGIGSTEERMNKLLKAKYEAGLLKPFNYINGYARLNRYMEQNIQLSSRQKILHQLQKFRPKFRERMQSLTNFELVLVEIWFERKLMEYERVFASMPIPACCWRRTGEIFRGNREMAELIGVPVERLRDGKLAIHEFVVEESLVDYWVKFGTIAFDRVQKGVLSRCALKRLDQNTKKDQELKCCVSFTVQRDNHHIPSLIIGNFLPIAPEKSAK